ncbi:MAG: hypothetical protein ACKVOK_12585 [Flavobacteriales bacterium]
MIIPMSAQQWQTINKQRFEELLAPTVAFFSSESFSFKLSYTSYLGHSSQKPFDTMTGFAFKDGKRHYYNMPGQLTLQNEDMRILLDSAEKVIIAMDRDDKFENTANDFLYETLFSADNTLEYASLPGGAGIIRIKFLNHLEYEMQETRIGQDGLVDSITLFYKNEIEEEVDGKPTGKVKPKMVCQFSEMITGVSLPEKFNLEKVIVKEKKTIKAVGKYADYELVDYRIDKPINRKN